MRKKISLLTISLIVIILAGLSITGISAYFTSRDSATNAVSIGNNEITIHEVFENPDIKPNDTTIIKKQVSIENIGKTYGAVRVVARFSNSDVLSYTNIDYNTAKWVKSGDYWYYKTPLAPGEETEPLFNKLTLVNPTEDQVKDFNVYVYSESRNTSPDATQAEIIAEF